MDGLIKQVEQWSIDRGLHESNADAQFRKTVEEIGELSQAISDKDKDAFIDAIGDVTVTLIILAQQQGIPLHTCLSAAYDEIKDRKGKLINGTFVKESDL